MNSILIQLNDSDLRDLITEAVSSAFSSFKPPQTPSPDDEFLTQAEVAKTLRTTKATVISWTKKNKLNVRRFGRKVLYSKAEVLKLGGL